jgi:two-component system, NarL family, response regulator LiaR
MSCVVYTRSASFQQFLRQHLDMPLDFTSALQPTGDDPRRVHLLHLPSLEQDCYHWLQRHASGKSIAAAVCSNLPDVGGMLECVRLGARGYCNSHMAALHYRQMLEMLANGQSWFPPALLAEAFRLAQQAAQAPRQQPHIESLTPRENQIAGYVAAGMSNRKIAELLEISEATVKSHLTRIFRKLQLKDRVALVLLLKQA